MYKKFIRNMIEDEIEKEFGYNIQICNLEFLDLSDSDTIYFKFESIFENCPVYGAMACYTSIGCSFVKDDCYKAIKEYYGR